MVLPLKSIAGGGWILPHTKYQTLPYITTLLSSTLLASYPLTILDATYALSPEHPCPAELEDARDVYDHVLAHPHKWDNSRISFSGNSSGGAIALGLAVTLGKEAREANQDDAWVHPIKAVFVCYAMTSWVGASEKNAAFLATLPANNPPRVMPNFVLDTITAAHFFSPSGSASKGSGAGEKNNREVVEAARKEALQRSPMVSPALADLRDFPPKVGIWTVEWDVMSADADGLRERLKAHSTDSKGSVSGRMIKGVGHGWDLEVHKGQVGWEEKEEAYQDLVKAVAWVGGLAIE
jgi:acetyl esterase/lipase